MGSSPAKFVDCGPGVCFVASTATTGELWYSDGTAAGTTLLCTLDPGGAANPDQLTMCRGRLFVDASSPTYGRELYGIATPGASRAVLGEASAPDRPRLATAGDAVPILGTTIALTGSGPPGYAGVLLVGGAGLPTAVPQLPGFLEGGADWTGVQAGNALTVATLPTASFTVPFAAPVDPAFEGLVLQLQTIWFHPTVAPTLQVSNGLQLVLGAATPH